MYREPSADTGPPVRTALSGRRAASAACGLRVRLAAWLALLVLLAGGATPGWAQALRVDGRGSVAVWPAVTLWTEADPTLTPAAVLARRDRFAVPTGTPSNLGRSTQAVWLRFGLEVTGDDPVQRVLEIDYPSLNRIDLYLVTDGRIVQHLAMGNALRKSERAMAARTHAAPLQLTPGRHEVLLHVRTQSSMLLPMTLRTHEAFTESESRVQIIQGVVLGLALCMFIYSLAHWVGLRDALFASYALLLAGNMVFVLAFFGTGAQHLWPDWPGLSIKVAPMAVMVAVGAGTRFMAAALDVQQVSAFIHRLLQVVSLTAFGLLLATALDLVDYRTAQTVATVLGLIAVTAVMPATYLRARQGQLTAAYMLFGWTFYAMGALVAAGLLRGNIEPTFWTQHVYPFSLLIEMSAWMAVLSLRVQAIHRNADRARLETETLRTLAQTDALTGLPNRRGLQGRIAAALPRARPQQLLALYLLDLDGFKPVNDRYGHDVGDALLVAVGQRLQAQLRYADVVARLGGDEFVVLVEGLTDEAAARAIGQKLLAVSDLPFVIEGQHCEVGLTVGYALAPLDGLSGEELLKRADAAMYAGKQGGRRCLQRGGRSLATA